MALTKTYQERHREDNEYIAGHATGQPDLYLVSN